LVALSLPRDASVKNSDTHEHSELPEVVVCPPNNDTALYRIVTRRGDLGASLTPEAMQAARRLCEVTLGPIGIAGMTPKSLQRIFSEQISRQPALPPVLRNSEVCTVSPTEILNRLSRARVRRRPN
jgi:hypothetical protein